MRTAIPTPWMNSAATKRLSWSLMINFNKTRARMLASTARRPFTFGDCFFTHQTADWTGFRDLRPNPITIFFYSSSLKTLLKPPCSCKFHQLLLKKTQDSQRQILSTSNSKSPATNHLKTLQSSIGIETRLISHRELLNPNPEQHKFHKNTSKTKLAIIKVQHNSLFQIIALKIYPTSQVMPIH